ncbi:MAG: sulfurtransferase complex subunit TusD [Halieaceae bacterium]
MKYSLLVLSAPDTGSGNLTAVRFAESLVAQGHKLYRVFFLDRGAATGLSSAVVPQDEQNVSDLWASLAEQHGAELILCIASALRQGVLDDSEAARYEHPSSTLLPGFEIGGLGLLVEALAESDRLLTFGG